MLKLMLFRHAKSSWATPDLADFERPLARRGEKAAPRMGLLIKEQGLLPDLVFCSPATRTRQTLVLALKAMKAEPKVIFDESFYLGQPSAILSRLCAVKSHPQTIMVVGHNPGIHELALELVGNSGRGEVSRLFGKFPTASLAVIQFACKSWSDIQRCQGELALYVTPRQIQ